MLHLALALFLSQGTPVTLWKTKPDPFTDEMHMLLRGEGKKGELVLTIGCAEQEGTLTFGFRFSDWESKAVVPWLALRFDDGSIERYSFAPLGPFIIMGFTSEQEVIEPTDEGNGLAWTLAIRDRMRVDLMAEEPLRRVVEEFDISEVTAETLNFMIKTGCTLNPVPRFLTPEEAIRLADEIGIAEE